MTKPVRTTIVFPLRGEQVLLGMKKRGFGEGWWNGFGGKVQPGESSVDGARRETEEECGLVIGNLKLVARLLFHFEDQLNIVSLAYTSDEFNGQPDEKEEMRPQWFTIDGIPYDTMWPADRQWIPRVIGPTASDTVLNFAIYFDDSKRFQRIEELPDDQVMHHFEEQT